MVELPAQGGISWQGNATSPFSDKTERTVVGIDGQKHVYQDVEKKGKNGHFTDEGEYRRAIEQAVAENR